MTAYFIFISIISLLIGYVLGSILPAYIIGRIKGIDIRKVGSKNAGTSNVYHELGIKYAVMTGFYDFFKGLLAIWIASLLQPNFVVMQLAAYAAIIGHVFPFYIKFKGGQGLATSMALLIYYIINFILIDVVILVFMLYLLLILILFKLICEVTNLLAMLIYPLILYSVWLYYPGNKFNIFISIIIGYIVVMAFYNIIKFEQIKFEKELKPGWWKLYLNPILMIFVILYAFIPLYISLILIGVLTIVIGTMDFIKYLNQNKDDKILRRIQKYFSPTEDKKYFTVLIILLGIFLTMIIFSSISKTIVITALTFTFLGIAFGIFFEIAFGKRKLLNRSLEGFIGYIICILLIAFILNSIFDITMLVILIGGLSGAIITILPLKTYYYLVTPLISSFLMVIFLSVGL